MEEENLNEKDENFFENLIKKLIDCLNNVGENIKNFQTKLFCLPKEQIISPINETQNILPDKNPELLNQIKNIQLFQKEIFGKFSFLSGLLTRNVELPEKIFNTLLFLQIKFIDLINSHQNYLDQNTCGEMILYSYDLYKGKDAPFINSKLKYVDPLIKLSFSFIDNEKFDLKTYLSDILTFAEKIICSNQIFTIEYKKKLMPGIVSKIIKVITNDDIKINSKNLSILIHLLSYFLSIVLDNYPKNDTNYVKFFEFFSCFILVFQNKFSKIIDNVHDEFTQMINNLFSHKNTEISDELYYQIILIMNNSMFKFEPNDYDKIIEINELFYKSCSSMKNFSKNKIYDNITNGINLLKISFDKKEFLRFNKGLIEVCGNLVIYYYSLNKKELKSLQRRDNKENDLNLLNELMLGNETENSDNIEKLLSTFIDAIQKIITHNKKIIFEVTNAYELSVKDITKENCYEKIKELFFSNLIFSYDLEIKLNLLFNVLKFLGEKSEDIYNYIYDKVTGILIQKTKKYYSILQKNKKISKNKFNQEIEEILNSLALFTFLIFLPSSNNPKIPKNQKNIKKINSLTQFYFSVFCENIEQYEINKIPLSKLNLINFYTIILCLHSMDIQSKISKLSQNSFIILAMVNYSNKISLLKYSSMLLVLYLSKDCNLKNFIVNNFNFIINTILNKVIYYSSTISTTKNMIINFFTSIIELINQVNNENMSNFYCGEFLKYIEKLFPYLDKNITNKKNGLIIELLLEMLIKISHFQNIVIENIYKEYKTNEPEKAAFEELENNKTNFLKILKEKTSIEEANVFRKLILRISPLILSKNIIFIGKTLSIISEYIPTLNILPMRREEDENFSTEDPNNVSIPSSLGPIMHEIWSYLIFASKNEGNKDRNTIVNFKSFYDIFKKILFYHPKFFNSERFFDNLLPTADFVFTSLKDNYLEMQYKDVIEDFIFEFLSRVIFANRYHKNFKEKTNNFINKYKEILIIDKSEAQLTEMNNNINSILSYFD